MQGSEKKEGLQGSEREEGMLGSEREEGMLGSVKEIENLIVERRHKFEELEFGVTKGLE